MKINGINNIGGINKYARSADSRSASVGKKEGQKDELIISSEAKELLGARNTENTQSTQRLEELKQQVSAGTYSVDARKIAEKLLPYIQ
jgi:negative regulator of flagellin synthesis FlgM